MRRRGGCLPQDREVATAQLVRGVGVKLAADAVEPTMSVNNTATFSVVNKPRLQLAPRNQRRPTPCASWPKATCLAVMSRPSAEAEHASNRRCA